MADKKVDSELEVVPMNSRDWDIWAKRAAKGKSWDTSAERGENQLCQGLTVVGGESVVMSAFIIRGYHDLMSVIENAKMYNGGLMAVDKSGTARGWCFVEQGYEGKPYEDAGGLSGSQSMETLLRLTSEAPVICITAVIAEDGYDVVDMISQFMAYLSEWYTAYNIVTYVPGWLLLKLKGHSGFNLQREFNRGRRWKPDEVDDNEIVLLSHPVRTHGNYGDISDLQDMEEMIDTLVETGLNSEFTEQRRRLAEGAGATPESIVRGRLFALQVRGSATNAYVLAGVIPEVGWALALKYGLPPKQVIAYGKKYMPELVMAVGHNELICDMVKYQPLGFRNLYIMALSRRAGIKAKALANELSGKEASCQNIIDAIKKCQRDVIEAKAAEAAREVAIAAEEKVLADYGELAGGHTHEQLGRAWRGCHPCGSGEKSVIWKEIYEALEKRGIDGYVAQIAWDARIDFSKFTGRLLWLQGEAEKRGVNVEQWFGCLRISAEAAIRKLDHDCSKSSMLSLIYKCSAPVNPRGDTVKSLLAEHKVSERDWLTYKVGAKDTLEVSTVSACVAVEKEVMRDFSGRDSDIDSVYRRSLGLTKGNKGYDGTGERGLVDASYEYAKVKKQEAKEKTPIETVPARYATRATKANGQVAVSQAMRPPSVSTNSGKGRKARERNTLLKMFAPQALGITLAGMVIERGATGKEAVAQ